MRGIEGKIALVTGASSGIGRATAAAFARDGARVVLADVDAAGGEQAVAEIRRAGGNALFVRADVSRAGEVENLVRSTARAFGGLDVAFNNAGIEGKPGVTAECPEDDWDHVLAVNLKSAWLCMRSEIPVLLERGGGAIVNCASIAGVRGFPGMPAYVASKHGMIGLTRTAALEYATKGIRINAVCPGVIHTAMLDRFTAGSQEAEAGLTAGTPLGRMGRPEEIAEAVLWLCSGAASFVTGHALVADGDWVGEPGRGESLSGWQNRSRLAPRRHPGLASPGSPCARPSALLSGRRSRPGSPSQP